MQVPARTYNPSYLVGWEQEVWGLRPAWANSLQDFISKVTRASGLEVWLKQ
jgi:hypothetical protein